MPEQTNNPPGASITIEETGPLADTSLEDIAHDLAHQHHVIFDKFNQTAGSFLDYLSQAEKLLHEAYLRIVRTSSDEIALSYAAEWLLDNYYMVQRTQRQIKEDLPEDYYRRLPYLTDEGPLQGYPRIYDLARVLVMHQQCQLDVKQVKQFVQGYQQVEPLTTGELWALPVMLRVVMLVSTTQAATDLADTALPDGPASFQLAYDFAPSDIIASCIPSLHNLAKENWMEFFEDVSPVEHILEQDPARLYENMSFDSRDQYRKVIEKLSRATGKSESLVARTVVRLTEKAFANNNYNKAVTAEDIPKWAGLSLPPAAHVGHYLLGAGKPRLEQELGFRPSLQERWRRWIYDHPTAIYLGSIAGITLPVMFLLTNYTARAGGSGWQILFTLLLLLIPSITIAVSIVNWLVTLTIAPHTCPKLDFSEGIPDMARTMVVIPSMLTSAEEVQSLLSQLEQHYLSNPDPNLSFALLTDFADAETATIAEDEALLAGVQEGIEALNARHSNRPFYLFHRRRLWNPQEQVWMGWERKRGKLHEFNRLLRGADDTSYNTQVGRLDELEKIRYVITLDSDTVLPRESGSRLVSTLAHPLNRAQFDPETGKVVAGYTVLQPRTEVQLTSANQSLFTRIFAGDVGLDLYTRAVSDVYQDLFGEGIFVGKGIYDVDAFERSLAGRVPENALLSHDLFEGIHGRAGLVTDIVLYEDYPPHYLIHVRRSHRWIRGDWQLLPWLLPWVPSQEGWVRNRLDLIDLWKMADNLRRSLLAPALLLYFLASWTVLPGSTWLWTLFGMLVPGIPLVTSMFGAVRQQLGGAEWVEVWRPIRDSIIRWLLYMAFLPYEALLHLDAIITTLGRILVSRRYLLQWTTAAHTTRLFGEDVDADATWQNMLSSLLLTVAVAFLVLLLHPIGLLAAAPLLLLWIFSPQLAYLISRPDRKAPMPISEEAQQRLRRLARRTWFFYERFVGPEDNWLPPDHFQEDPKGIVAHRTSPTNVGLYLLSAVAAYDLGYIAPMSLTLRLGTTLDTLQRLDRYRGHFLNWIDTRSLLPLPPRYVSAVDSGNLAGCLIALEQACLQLPNHPAWRWVRWQGLLDTAGMLLESVQLVSQSRYIGSVVEEHVEALREQVVKVKEQPEAWPRLLSFLAEEWGPQLDVYLVDLVEQCTPTVAVEQLQECRLYTERIHHHIQGMSRQAQMLLPWLAAFQNRPAFPSRLEGAWREVATAFPLNPSLESLPNICKTGKEALSHFQEQLEQEEGQEIEVALVWCRDLLEKLQTTLDTSRAVLIGAADMAVQCDQFVQEMDFVFLFDEKRQVFHIGYNLDASKLDNNYYDLLASEARIASLVAIAKNDVPISHWLHLSRPVTDVSSGRTLLSWSGTMFEYLMPPLLLRSYDNTLLSSSQRTAIAHQIAYGQQQEVPWGISESGFYTFDQAQNYQYRAFGVPGLGFQRGLGDDLVIAPYASLLALPLQPQAVLANLDALERINMLGRYGLYEAVDFTETRLPLGTTQAIVRSYMAHHQGMIMLALTNYLDGQVMVNRFHADPRIQSVELLLQEQIPRRSPPEQPHEEETVEAPLIETPITVYPWVVEPETPFPAAHFLSNGSYSLLITNAGSGFSRWQERMLTRWHPDTTQDDWGQWLYLQDEESGAYWSAGLQPTAKQPEGGMAVQFHPHMAEFRRRDQGITLHMEVMVAPEDDVEIRRVEIANDTAETRHLRLTSYGEVVLTDQGTDIRHPAFVKLFVESEYLPEHNALLFRRRPRSAQESPAFLIHSLLTEDEHEATGEHESDRARFLGRGRTARNPAAISQGEWLSGTTGPTLDPVMSLGQRFTLPPHNTTTLTLITAAADSREQAVALAAQYRSWSVIDRAFSQARLLSERELQRLEIGTPMLEQGQYLLSLLLYPHPARRAEQAILAANDIGQPGLWSFSISGDNPILLVQMGSESEGDLLQNLLQIHSFWRNRGLQIDLVVLNVQESNYGQGLQGYIHRLIHRSDDENWLNRNGGIFVVNADQIRSEERTLLLTAARAVLDATLGTSLSEQLVGLYHPETRLPLFVGTRDPAELTDTTPVHRPQDLLYDNGFGGFSPDGREYQIFLEPGQSTPAPWINVIANPDFGFLVSETGGGYSWAINSGENRLTTWRNDPVTDLPAEVIYIRDEETAQIWSPTPQPAPADAPYLLRHGAGYSIFHHNSHGLSQEVRLFTSPEDPVKIIELHLENIHHRQRRLTVTYYAEMVLGTNRETTQPYLIPQYNQQHNSLLFRNPYNVEFAERVAFLASSREPHGLTTDRTEFLGRLGSYRHPSALTRIGLDNQVAPGLDPCAAIQLHVELAPGEKETVYFLLGQGATEEDTTSLLEQYLEPAAVAAAWRATHEQWDSILGAVQVETPDPTMDLLLNRWLLYQALACRIWGRSALYQSSGAYGFRDQLQDVMSLIHTRPDLTREQIIRAAQHQFEAGDVLHWWHPPSGRGVRTRIRDDLLWLPFVTAYYVAATGDKTVLEEQAPFLKGPLLQENEEERYGFYESTTETYSIFEHCRRAIQNGTSAGRHGLPLMGGGDWNDGMNRVGIEGEGESVWLGWFLHNTLTRFAALCDQQGEAELAEGYRQQAQELSDALEISGWDGAWYRRAYYDDGTPLGSHLNDECQIDAIAQSWSVLSGAADPERAYQAMQSVNEQLIRREDRLLLLFTPPFNDTPKDPGYIKGYLPGIRENGGQYTHAALWTIWAFAELGQGEMAAELFRMTNPICRSDSREKAEHYKVEPYVIVADVYGVEPHVGRGGWTWYTGSSGWMWRLGVEAILGLRREGETLRLDPRIPPTWERYKVTYRHGQTTYQILVENPDSVSQGVVQVVVDGLEQVCNTISLIDDGGEHQVRVRLGEP